MRLKILPFIFILALGTSYASEIPYSVRFIVYHAQRLMEKREYDKAIELLKGFQKRNKSCSKHYLIDFILGNCFFMKGDYRTAVNYYQGSVKKNPEFFSGWFNLAECLYKLKRYRDAASSFIKAYSVSAKKDPEYLYYAGISFLNAGMCRDAIRVLKKLPLKKIEWREAIAHAYISCNEFREALPFVEELSEKKIKNRKMWQRIRVQIYLSLGMEDKALSYLKRLVKEDPVDPIWWKGLAHIYLRKNKYKDALCALIIKGFLLPLSDQEKKVAAQLSLALGIPKQALKFYVGLLNKRSDPGLYYYISQCYIRIHKLKDAIFYLNRAIKLRPDKKYLILKANLLYQMGEYKSAGMIFERLARRNIEPEKMWLMAGYSYINAGDLREGYFALNQAKKYSKNKKRHEK